MQKQQLARTGRSLAEAVSYPDTSATVTALSRHSLAFEVENRNRPAQSTLPDATSFEFDTPATGQLEHINGHTVRVVSQDVAPFTIAMVVAPSERRHQKLLHQYGLRRVIHTATSPVLLAQGAPSYGYTRILIPTDMSAVSEAAARAVLAKWPQAQTVFLHAVEIVEENPAHHGYTDVTVFSARARARESARVELNRFVDNICPTRQLVSRVVQYGNPMKVVLNYATRMRSDLIAVTAPSKSWCRRLFSHTIALSLAHRTLSDVLVLPEAMLGA